MPSSYSTDFLIDCSLANARTDAVPVGPYTRGSVQIVQQGTGAGAKYRVARSLNGVNFEPFPEPVNLYTSGVAAFSLVGVSKIRVEVTTADATADAKVRVYFYCEAA